MNTYRQGEHICALHSTPDEQRTVAAEYLADGLRRRERAFYVADSPTALQRFMETLHAHGIDAAAALANGALITQTHAQAHLQDGRFDSERMLGLLNDGVEAALNAGFAGLRTCGDMSWLLQEPAGAEQVVEYEAHLNQFFQRVRACGMCQYDRTRLSPALIEHGLDTHSSAVVDGRHKPNPFFDAGNVAGLSAPPPGGLAWKISELQKR